MQLSETNEDPQVRKEVSDEDDFDDEPQRTLQFLKLLIVEKVLGQVLHEFVDVLLIHVELSELQIADERQTRSDG